ncbi:MAG TPA: hypothetical protein VEA41_08945 [Salinarimonas sp.]|nr:hypothetical protein [Salinarimonas sp.]
MGRNAVSTRLESGSPLSATIRSARPMGMPARPANDNRAHGRPLERHGRLLGYGLLAAAAAALLAMAGLLTG